MPDPRPNVVEASAMELAAAIRRGELSSAEVVDAHITMLERFQPCTRAVAVDRFEQAREQARQADQMVSSAADRDPESLPPLLGVPFTVKESIALEGMPHTAGVISRREVRAARSATVVGRLLDAGAIPLAVTNVSELTLWIESENPVYGRTSNPYDEDRTAGGSSGGEGAAVGCGGSPFGVGADIAGSIRIPALFCGVFGHKPSVGVVPQTGMWPLSPSAASAALLSVGPLTRRAADLMPLLRLMAGPDGVDPLVTGDAVLGDPQSVSLEGLTVTVLEKTSVLRFSREMLEARDRAAAALVSAGATLRSVRLPSWRRAVLPFLAALVEDAPDGGATAALLAEAGSGLREVHTLPTRISLQSERLGLMVERLADRTSRRRSEVGRGAAYRTKLLASAGSLAAELREAIGDGVLLHPAHPTVAPAHRRTYGRPWLMTPAAMFNLAGVPVTEVPLGLARSGLPLGVQVAGAVGSDHLTIAVAAELERVFGGWVPPGV